MSTPQVDSKEDSGLLYPDNKVIKGTTGPTDDMAVVASPSIGAKVVIDRVSDDPDEVANAAPTRSKPVSSPDNNGPIGMTKNAKRFSKIFQLVFSDNLISPKGKMAKLPKYAWNAAPITAPSPTATAPATILAATPMAKSGFSTY